MDESTLHRFSETVSPSLREQFIGHTESPDDRQEPVLREDGSAIDLVAIDHLMAMTRPAVLHPAWIADRATVDRWLAPRLHYALRLTRAQAADRSLWAWLAVRYNTFVVWRWRDAAGVTSEDRWSGPVHKQALMRLWWGAELFRDGADYEPAERAFLRQDLPNSYLHRPLARCRSLALALVDVIAPKSDQTVRSSDEINDLARVLNLVMAGCPPELATDFRQDDHTGYARWLDDIPTIPADWDETPTGPTADDTTETSRAGGRGLAERSWAYADQARQHRNRQGQSATVAADPWRQGAAS